MGIGQIGNYGGLYGNYRAQNMKTVDLETVREQDARKLAEEKAGYGIAPVGTDERVNTSVQKTGHNEAQSDNYDRARASVTNLQDISLTFQKFDDFGYIGQDASLSGLDMEKALSDVKKDQVLDQYSYFVGSADNMISSSEDGTVIRK